MCLVRKRGQPPHAAEKIYAHEMKESVEALNQQFLYIRVFKAVNWTGMQVKHVKFCSLCFVYDSYLSNSWAYPHQQQKPAQSSIPSLSAHIGN